MSWRAGFAEWASDLGPTFALVSKGSRRVRGVVMQQAIVTKYLGPTNHRGARVKATAYAGTLTLAWDYELDTNGNHTAAALALAVKYGWLDNGWTFHAGGMPNGAGNVYVLARAEPCLYKVLERTGWNGAGQSEWIDIGLTMLRPCAGHGEVEAVLGALEPPRFGPRGSDKLEWSDDGSEAYVDFAGSGERIRLERQ